MSLLALILSLAALALTWFAAAQKLYWLILGVVAIVLAVIGLKKQKSVVAVIALLVSLAGAGFPGFLVYLDSNQNEMPPEMMDDNSDFGSNLDDIESGFGDEDEPPPAE